MIVGGPMDLEETLMPS